MESYEYDYEINISNTSYYYYLDFYIYNVSPISDICFVAKILIGAAAVIANAATFLMICCIRRVRKQQNVLIANLAVVDFIVGVSTVWFTLSYGVSDSISSLNSTSDAMFSLTWVFAVSFERFIAIVVAPIRYRYAVTKCRLTLACAILWVFSIAFVCYMTLMLLVGIYDRSYLTKVYIIYFSMTCIVGLTYGIIFIFVKRQSDKFKNGSASGVARQTRLTSLFFTFAILFGLLCFCLLPNQIFMMYLIHNISGGTYTLNNTFQAVFYDISHVLLPLNSALNPFVYWWRIPEFRDGYKKLIRPCNRGSSCVPEPSISSISNTSKQTSDIPQSFS